MYRTIGLAALAALLLAAPAQATDFVVTNNFDVGAGSLRQAIDNANATTGPDTISFGDLGSNNRITPDIELPTITEAVVIDGYTHPGASPNTLAVGDNAVLKVELSGDDFLGGTPAGLTIASSGSTVKGLAINRFEGSGIRLAGGGGHFIQGNFIGTDLGGTVDLSGIPNAASNGVRLEGSSSNLIGGATAAARNVISGNGNDGVEIQGTASVANAVQGNYVGTTKSGTVALGNDQSGVSIDNGAAGTTIGGATALARNVLSANVEGVSIDGDATSGTLVRGNYIGTSATGTQDLGNLVGVDSHKADAGVIGGTAAGQGNVISGNGGTGVTLRGGATELATGNRIEGNRIGTNAAGTAALRNDFDGIQVQATAPDTTVGGVVPGARNVISGNGGYGVYISQNGSRVQGNYIGTNAAGTAAVGNARSGILAFSSGVGLVIGGTAAGARNVVSGNRAAGIECLGFTEVVGNYVGLDAAGTAAVPNENGIAARTQSFIGLTQARTPAGNVISGNRNAGVLISGQFASNVEVDANLIGTNAAGTAAVPNADGVTIEDGGSTAALGFTARNVISGNDFAGVLIQGPGFGYNMLDENYIGLNRAGTGAVPNGVGVEVAAGATNNHIGRQESSKRNVIAGNRFEGVLIHGVGTELNEVVRAYVGIRPDALRLGNTRGVVISEGARRNTVGGSSAALANTISGNLSDGVLITGAGTDRNVVRGNQIGTTPSGNGPISNVVGVNITAGARFNTVGGPLNAPRSLISGNTTAGVRVADTATQGTRIQGNLIGTGPGGTGPMANGAGVIVTAGAQATTIGGTGSLGNRIGFNSGSGVLVDGASTTGAEITRNAIFRNGLGINLRPPAEAVDVATPNDLDDPDGGPNSLQNFPVIRAATGSPGTTTISGTLNSRPGSGFRVEVFRKPPGPDTADETFVGAVTATTNAGGDATWSLTVPADHSGQILRATATKLDARNTSELSGTRVVG